MEMSLIGLLTKLCHCDLCEPIIRNQTHLSTPDKRLSMESATADSIIALIKMACCVLQSFSWVITVGWDPSLLTVPWNVNPGILPSPSRMTLMTYYCPKKQLILSCGSYMVLSLTLDIVCIWEWHILNALIFIIRFRHLWSSLGFICAWLSALLRCLSVEGLHCHLVVTSWVCSPQTSVGNLSLHVCEIMSRHVPGRNIWVFSESHCAADIRADTSLRCTVVFAEGEPAAAWDNGKAKSFYEKCKNKVSCLGCLASVFYSCWTELKESCMW